VELRFASPRLSETETACPDNFREGVGFGSFPTTKRPRHPAETTNASGKEYISYVEASFPRQPALPSYPAAVTLSGNRRIGTCMWHRYGRLFNNRGELVKKMKS
jgi:hypothetical protein